MRHFLQEPTAVAALARGVAHPTAARFLVALAGATKRLRALKRGATSGAVDVAVVAAPADPHLTAASQAVVEPVAAVAHPDGPAAGRLDTARESRYECGGNVATVRDTAVSPRARGYRPGSSPRSAAEARYTLARAGVHSGFTRGPRAAPERVCSRAEGARREFEPRSGLRILPEPWKTLRDAFPTAPWMAHTTRHPQAPQALRRGHFLVEGI